MSITCNGDLIQKFQTVSRAEIMVGHRSGPDRVISLAPDH